MFVLGHMGSQQASLKERNRALVDLRKKVNEMSTEKKAKDKLLKLQAVMECEPTVCRELKEELS